MTKTIKVTLKIKKDVIDYFKKNNENSSNTIAEKFGISEHQVNTILDNYFKTIQPKR